jgi:hypothetical protein
MPQTSGALRQAGRQGRDAGQGCRAGMQGRDAGRQVPAAGCEPEAGTPLRDLGRKGKGPFISTVCPILQKGLLNS